MNRLAYLEHILSLQTKMARNILVRFANNGLVALIILHSGITFSVLAVVLAFWLHFGWL